MTEVLSTKLYHNESEDVRQCRKTFYSSQKETTETPKDWYGRIREAINCCDFGILTEFLLIDKFFCELGFEEIKPFQSIDSWNSDQLCDFVTQFETIYQENGPISDAESTAECFEMLEIKLNDDIHISPLNTSRDDIDFIDTNSEDHEKMGNTTTKLALDQRSKTKVEPTNTTNGEKKNDIKPRKTRQLKNTSGVAMQQQNQFECSDCEKVFEQKIAYKRHKRVHSWKRFHSCSICDKSYSKSCYLKKHLQSHEQGHSISDRTFECHLCKFQFLATNGLRMHMKVKHVVGIKNELLCKHCNDVFVKQELLDVHLRQVHQANISYKCPHCTREFDQITSMKKHEIIHSEAKPFMCEVCGNAFKTKKQLQLHMARHTDERRFKCGECGLMLKSRSNYKNHMRLHTGERPFKCDQCERTFVQRANYLKHVRWHTGERPHGCTYCDKRFPTAYDMKLHINSIHTGDKPFACDSCDRSFAQPSTLRVHRLRVHKQ